MTRPTPGHSDLGKFPPRGVTGIIDAASQPNKTMTRTDVFSVAGQLRWQYQFREEGSTMAIDDNGQHIGRRIREIRSWRQMTLSATAELAGITAAYLSYIERGLRPVTKRSVLESLANALRVAPTELAGAPFTQSDPIASDSHAAVAGVEQALTVCELGQLPDADNRRPWPVVAAELERLNRDLRPATDYRAQGDVLPGLLTDLHALYVTEPNRRREILIALLQCLHTAAVLTKNLGARGLPTLAAQQATRVADELDTPEWRGLAAWLRGNTAGRYRTFTYSLSVSAADELTRHLDDRNVQQIYGMLHLNAALAAAVQENQDTVNTHLAEAEAVASRMEVPVGAFANLYFGQPNVAVWKLTLASELGDSGRVVEAARSARPDPLPSAARRSEYWATLGRTLAAERRSREDGIAAILKAEEIAPQYIRNKVFVRETVADLLRSAQRDAGGREVRGLAWRMGVAPVG